MSPADWISLVSICLLGAFSPGPSLMVIIACTTEHGRKAGILASVGHGLGVFGYALAAATGLSYLLNSYQTVFFALQLLGAGLLLWLGIRILISLFKGGNNGAPSPDPAALQHAFRDGFLIAVFNPKIAAFFISLFSQFLAAGQPVSLHIAMAGLAGFIDMAVYVFYAILASTPLINGMLSRYASVRDGVFALILISLAVSLFASQLAAYQG